MVELGGDTRAGDDQVQDRGKIMMGVLLVAKTVSCWTALIGFCDSSCLEWDPRRSMSIVLKGTWRVTNRHSHFRIQHQKGGTLAKAQSGSNTTLNIALIV